MYIAESDAKPFFPPRYGHVPNMHYRILLIMRRPHAIDVPYPLLHPVRLSPTLTYTLWRGEKKPWRVATPPYSGTRPYTLRKALQL